MKSKTASGLMLTLLLMGMLTFAFNIQPSTAALKVHNIDTGEDFTTIQGAIDDPDTLNWHTIRVDAGTYFETVVVNKYVALIGENKYNTIIDGGGAEIVISVLSAIEISGFTIRNGRDGINIELGGTDISHNIIKNTECGIYGYLLDSDIINNDISNNDLGICIIDFANGNNISGNNISNNGMGIYLASSWNNTLRNNNINNNKYNFGVTPYWTILPPYRYDIDTSNTVDGKPIYWWVNQHDKEIPSDAGYVGLIDSTNITIKDSTLTKNWQGIFFYNVSNSIITNVTLANNYYGIDLQNYNNNNTFFHNNFINNKKQVRNDYSASSSTWDDGYPSGGNYWSNYNGLDLYRGPYQNETDSDGIGDTSKNIYGEKDNFPLMKPYGGSHDIGILLSVSKTAISEGYNTTVTMNVTIINYGLQSETFNFTFNIDPIFHEQNMTLISRNSTAMNFTWNNTGLPRDSYPIYANTTLIPGETDTTDNNIVRWILITIEGDVDGDRDVDGGDQRNIQNALFAEPGGPDWDYNADVDCDDDVDGGDQRKCQNNMFESW